MKNFLTDLLDAVFLDESTYKALQSAPQPVPVTKGCQLPARGESQAYTHCIISGGSEHERYQALRQYTAHVDAPVVVLTSDPNLAAALGTRAQCLCSGYDPLCGKTNRQASILLQAAARDLKLDSSEMSFVLRQTLEALREDNGALSLENFLGVDCATLSQSRFISGDDAGAEVQTLAAARALDDFRDLLARNMRSSGPSKPLNQLCEPLTVFLRSEAETMLAFEDLLWTLEERLDAGLNTVVVLDGMCSYLTPKQLRELYKEKQSTLICETDLPAMEDAFTAAASGLSAAMFFRHESGAKNLSNYAGSVKRAQISNSCGETSAESEWGGGPFGLFGNTTKSYTKGMSTVLVEEPLIRPEQIRNLGNREFYYYQRGRFIHCQF